MTKDSENANPNGDKGSGNSRNRLVSLSLAVPSSTVPHAGGQYVRSHLEFLSEKFEIDIIAPYNVKNTTELQNLSPTSVVVHLLNHGTAKLIGMGGQLRRAVNFLDDGLTLGASIRADADVRQAIEAADVVEFQWTQMLTGFGAVRKLTGAPAVAISHDVVSQARERQYEARGSASRIQRKVVSPILNLRNRIIERRALNAVDLCLVFSEKDKNLLNEMGVTTRVEVVNPPLMFGPPQPRNADPDKPRVLFVGAFQRAENDEAARWLIQSVWPVVHRAVPRAELVLCGANPTDGLLALVSRAPGVRATGFVEEIDAEYSAASVAVVPLMTGAGVKFKTISAMIHGVPVVSTPVGAEGIGGPECYVSITDDPERFAQATISVLEDPRSAEEKSSMVQSWAQENYSAKAVKKQLQGLYSRLLYSQHSQPRQMVNGLPSTGGGIRGFCFGASPWRATANAARWLRGRL